jgi:insertion element IS1 protein InsB
MRGISTTSQPLSGIDHLRQSIRDTLTRRVAWRSSTFIRKAETVAIERNNGRQRHWFARFRRKSVVVSKSLQMVDLTMALFAHFYVNGQPEEILSLFG